MNYELRVTFVSLQENDENVISEEGDLPLKGDGLYIECDDQSTACYRGVASIRRVGERLEIDLTEKGRQHIGVEQVMITPLPWTATMSEGLARLADLSRGEYTVERQP